MTNLEKVFNYNGNRVRVELDGDNIPWFIAKDVCNVLDISWSAHTLSKIKDEWQGVVNLTTPGGMQKLKTVNENAVYKLAFRSNKPEAEKFTEWVCSEVLSALRKTGSYSMHPPRTINGMDITPLHDNPHMMAFINSLITTQENKQRSIENRKRLQSVEDKVDKLGPDNGYLTVLGYLKTIGKTAPPGKASTMGRKAASYCRMNDIKMDKIHDTRYGLVGIYPVHVLEMIVRGVLE